MKSSTGREAQKVTLKAVADLDLVISRKFNPESVRYQTAPDIYQSPAKISRRYCPDSEDSEDSDVISIPSLAPRLKGMDTLLKLETLKTTEVDILNMLCSTNLCFQHFGLSITIRA